MSVNFDVILPRGTTAQAHNKIAAHSATSTHSHRAPHLLRSRCLETYYMSDPEILNACVQNLLEPIVFRKLRLTVKSPLGCSPRNVPHSCHFYLLTIYSRCLVWFYSYSNHSDQRTVRNSVHPLLFIVVQPLNCVPSSQAETTVHMSKWFPVCSICFPLKCPSNYGIRRY